MRDEIKNDIIRWVSLGWEYRIIHRLLLRKYNYFLSREVFVEIGFKIAKQTAAAYM